MINIEMPEEHRRYVLDYQSKAKGDKGRGQYSQQEAILAIILDHKKLVEKNILLEQEIEELKKT